jgi:hypothetical protein
VDAPEVPPILELPQFLSRGNCRMLREWAVHAIENGANKCDDYLSYRSNQEVQLIDDAMAENDGTLVALTAEHKGGFPVRVS